MNDRILVKVSATENCISFRTITRKEKSPHSFFVLRSELERLEQDGVVVTADVCSFAVLQYCKALRQVSIQFSWLSQHGRKLNGREETVHLSYDALMDFASRSGKNAQNAQWSALSMEEMERPRLIFCEKKNLHAAQSNKLVRRKLVRFLRDNFKWKGTEQICFYNDSIPYSFFFREYRNGQPGICGGLILHGQENMDRAYYAIHT